MIYITNDMMNDYGYINAEEIQKFLEKIGSWLATFKPDGETLFSSWFDLACRSNNYEPIFWLAFLQKEQSLTEAKKAPEQKRIDWALGYGCPEGGGRNPKYKGFINQFESAMKQFKNYETWSPIKKWSTTSIMLYDSPETLKKYGVSKYIKAESVEDAKNFLYNPRIEGVANLAAIWERYYKICFDMNLISE